MRVGHNGKTGQAAAHLRAKERDQLIRTGLLGGQCPLIGDKIVIYGFFHKRKYIASRLGSRISCISRRNTQFLKLLSLVAPPVDHSDDPHSKILVVDPKIH